MKKFDKGFLILEDKRLEIISLEISEMELNKMIRLASNNTNQLSESFSLNNIIINDSNADICSSAMERNNAVNKIIPKTGIKLLFSEEIEHDDVVEEILLYSIYFEKIEINEFNNFNYRIDSYTKTIACPNIEVFYGCGREYKSISIEEYDDWK